MYDERRGRQLFCPARRANQIAAAVTGPCNRPRKAVRVKSNLLNGFSLIWVVQLSSQIYTSSLSPQISGYFRASRLDKRGVSRSSRTRGGMWWTRQRQAREVVRRAGSPVSEHGAQDVGAEAYGKTVWSWHPLLVSSWRRLTEPNRVRSAVNSPAMEARRIRLQGERGISRQTIAQGMPECSGCTCMLVCALSAIFAHETAGAASTRHSLHPPISKEGTSSCKPRAQCVARMRRHICVGWVERSETHHSPVALMGIASLHPSYELDTAVAGMTWIGRGVPDTPASVGYDAPLEPRKILQPAARSRFRSTGHAHVRGRFPVDLDND